MLATAQILVTLGAPVAVASLVAIVRAIHGRTMPSRYAVAAMLCAATAAAYGLVVALKVACGAHDLYLAMNAYVAAMGAILAVYWRSRAVELRDAEYRRLTAEHDAAA